MDSGLLYGRRSWSLVDNRIFAPSEKSRTCLSKKRRDEDGYPVYCPQSMPSDPKLKMYLVPCSCETTFAVSEKYDRQGTAWSRYLTCPSCGKRHDPKNRLLQIGYQRAGYWTVDEC